MVKLQKLIKINSWTRNGYKYVKIIGILDYSTVVSFKNKFGTVKGLKQLKIDMRGTKFLDSTGIFVLTEIINQCRENDIKINLINISMCVYEVFRILGLNQVFGEEIFDCLDIKYDN